MPRGCSNTTGLSCYTYSLLFGKSSITLDDIKSFEKLDLAQGPFSVSDTLKSDSINGHSTGRPLLLTKEEYPIYIGPVSEKKDSYIRISAHGWFDVKENSYNEQASMRLIFLDQDSNILTEKLIKIEPLMSKGLWPLNSDYMGDPGTWTDFNFMVKRPPHTSRIRLTAFNLGYNQTLIDHVVIENRVQ